MSNLYIQGKVEFLEENNIDQVCYYLFNIVGRAVCGYQLSPGDIICIMWAQITTILYLYMATEFPLYS